jgi:hypothetical protein
LLKSDREIISGGAVKMSKRYLGNLVQMPVIKLVCAVAALALIGWGANSAWIAWRNHGTPSCSWPVQVQGVSTGQQVGLVRCYLQALATRDATMLTTVAANIPPVRITKADLAYSADARAGLATATFAPNPFDTTDVLLTIVYANGVRESTGIMNMIAMGGPSGWRMTIGTPLNTSGPLPAAALP